VAPGTSVPLSQQFTYFATSGNSSVGLDVEEQVNNGGYLTIGGTRDLSATSPDGGNYTCGVPISQISQKTFMARAPTVTNTIKFKTYNRQRSFNTPVTAKTRRQAS
jgi:hypothetical protein